MKGTVVRFYRARGFGFIKPDDGGKRVLAHYEDVVTDDEWPYIQAGTEVEFKLVDKNGKRKAENVTLVGGEKIPQWLPNDSDRVANDDDVFRGTIKFFDGRKGWGMIVPDDEITWEGVSTTDGVYFSRDNIITTGERKGKVLSLPRGLKVTFKVYKDKKKSLGAHELQKEDGTPLEYEERKRGGRGRKRKRGKRNKKSAKKAKVVRKTKEELLEEREIDEEENLYTGAVKFYDMEKEYGFISIEDAITFNGNTVKDAIYVLKDDIVCRSEEVGLNEGKKVVFKVYKDSKGLGACEVQNEDGSAIIFEQEDAQTEEVEEEPAAEGVVKRRRSTRITNK